MRASLLRLGTSALLVALAIPSLYPFAVGAADPPSLRALFLGDNGHHKPEDCFKQLRPVLAAKHIKMDYTGSLADLSASKLAGYDCMVIYANHTEISPEQEKTVLDFVKAGGGLAAL